MRCPICDELIPIDEPACPSCGGPLPPPVEEVEETEGVEEVEETEEAEEVEGVEEVEEQQDLNIEEKLQAVERDLLDNMLNDIEEEFENGSEEKETRRELLKKVRQHKMEEYEADVCLIFFHLSSGRISEAKQELLDMILTVNADKKKEEYLKWQMVEAKLLTDEERLNDVAFELEAMDPGYFGPGPFGPMAEKIRGFVGEGDHLGAEKGLLELKIALDAWTKRQAFEKREIIDKKKEELHKKRQDIKRAKAKDKFKDWLQLVDKRPEGEEEEEEGEPLAPGPPVKVTKCTICGISITEDMDSCPVCGTVQGVFKRREKVPETAKEEAFQKHIEGLSLKDKEVIAEAMASEAGLLYEDNHVKKALDTYDRSLSVTPTSEAYNGKGVILLDLGLGTKSLSCFEMALDIEPDDPSIWYNKAGSLDLLEKHDAAREALAKALEFDPDFEDTKELGRTLLAELGKKEVGPGPEPEPIEEETADVVEMAPIEAEGGAQEDIGDRSLKNGKRLRTMKGGKARAGGLRRRKGLTNGNGLVNGRGLTNGTGLVNGRGLTNGTGLVNGRGLISGNGLVNGRGLINGNVLSEATKDGMPTTKPIRRRKRSKMKIALLVLIAVGLFVSAPIANFLITPEADRMHADGNFSDWSDVIMYEDGRDPSIDVGELDIIKYSVTKENNQIYLYVEVAGDILSGTASPFGVDMVNVLIDTDGRSGSGYSMRGIGVDTRIMVYGFDGVKKGGSVTSFDDGGDPLDWNSWDPVGGVDAAIKGNRMEIGISREALGLEKGSTPLILFQVMDTHSGIGDYSEALITLGGAPSISIRQSSEDCPDLALAGTVEARFLALELSAKGKDVEVQSLTFTRGGGASDADTDIIKVRTNTGNVLSTGTFSGGTGKLTLSTPIRSTTGQRNGLEVVVDIPSGTTGTTFRISIDDRADVVADGAIVTLLPPIPLKMSYLGAPPVDIVIDGAFTDWERVASNTDPVGDAQNPNIDIVDYRGYKKDTKISFYVKVDGTMMAGTSTPIAEITRPAPGPEPGPPGPAPEPGPVVPIPELVGTDEVRVLIDADNFPLTGCHVEGLGLNFGAEYALVVTGIDGQIMERVVFEWSASDKEWDTIGTFEAANDDSRMEMQTPLAILGLNETSAFDVHFFATDWDQKEDLSNSKMEFVDPLQLTADGEIESSSDGNTWDYETDLHDSATDFVDMDEDNNGYVFVLQGNGDVWKSTGDWTDWDLIIEKQEEKDFIAIAIDDGSANDPPTYTLYGLQTDGDAFRTTLAVADWSKAGDIGANTDYVDMCYVSGIGNAATLYAIRKAVADKPYKTVNGGTAWATFENINIGNEGGSDTAVNTGIVVGYAWGNETNQAFVLQTDGDIRYRGAKLASPWPRINAPISLISDCDYIDIDYEASETVKFEGFLWIVTTKGQTYMWTTKGADGGGAWTKLGTSGQTNVVAIAVNEIPEFRDLVIPMMGTVTIFIILKRQRRRRRTSGSRPPTIPKK